eukprot:jgi/Bigna1/85245/estExt_fgenesh1_pg.C_30053
MHIPPCLTISDYERLSYSTRSFDNLKAKIEKKFHSSWDDLFQEDNIKRKIDLCKDWATGECSRTNCTFLHAWKNPIKKSLCFKYLKGQCYYKSCFFQHLDIKIEEYESLAKGTKNYEDLVRKIYKTKFPGDTTDFHTVDEMACIAGIDHIAAGDDEGRKPHKKYKICDKWERGLACYSSSCNYLHAWLAPGKEGVCINYNNGYCSRSDANCHFQHIDIPITEYEKYAEGTNNYEELQEKISRKSKSDEKQIIDQKQGFSREEEHALASKISRVFYQKPTTEQQQQQNVQNNHGPIQPSYNVQNTHNAPFAAVSQEEDNRGERGTWLKPETPAGNVQEVDKWLGTTSKLPRLPSSGNHGSEYNPYEQQKQPTNNYVGHLVEGLRDSKNDTREINRYYQQNQNLQSGRTNMESQVTLPAKVLDRGNPVDSHTERIEIEKGLERSDRFSRNPLSTEILRDKSLHTPNHSLRSQIDEWRGERKMWHGASSIPTSITGSSSNGGNRSLATTVNSGKSTPIASSQASKDSFQGVSLTDLHPSKAFSNEDGNGNDQYGTKMISIEDENDQGSSWEKKDMKDWSVVEVGSFIRARGTNEVWKRIADLFIEIEVDGASLVSYIGELKDFREDFPNVKPHHARTIVKSITEFKPL